MTGVDHPFAIVPLDLVTDETMPSFTVRVYAVLAEKANSAGICWPGIDALAEQLHISDRATRRCIRALETAGWIEVERRNHGMIQQTNVYRINRILPTSTAADTADPIGPVGPMVAACTGQDHRPSQSGSHRPSQSGEEQDPIEQDPIDSTKDPTGHDKPSSHGVLDEIEAFEAWWQHVPRKVGKGKARDAYRRARKKASDKILLDAVIRWAATSIPGDKFTPHPTTWLNAERWDDEDPTTPSDAASTSEPGPRQPPIYIPDPTPADQFGSAAALKRIRQKAGA